MPFMPYKDYEIYYELATAGPRTPVVAFVNGLTQRTLNWASYAEALNRSRISVLTFDLLGQGLSDKPYLQTSFEENGDVLIALLDHLGIEQAYVAGISFGGVIVLQLPIRFPERIKGIVPMSCFSEMDRSMWMMGENLHTALVRVNFDYLVNWLGVLNFSAKRMEGVKDNWPAMKRMMCSSNDVYAIQNLMESLRNFKGFTGELGKIRCPALILNGEFDSFTPRHYHETLRKNIENCRLMLIQRAYHAFTIEFPELTQRIIADFVKTVEEGRWQGDQTVWVASDSLESPEIAFPCQGDHTRAIPFFRTPPEQTGPAAPPPAVKRATRRRPS